MPLSCSVFFFFCSVDPNKYENKQSPSSGLPNSNQQRSNEASAAEHHHNVSVRVSSSLHHILHLLPRGKLSSSSASACMQRSPLPPPPCPHNPSAWSTGGNRDIAINWRRSKRWSNRDDEGDSDIKNDTIDRATDDFNS